MSLTRECRRLDGIVWPCPFDAEQSFGRTFFDCLCDTEQQTQVLEGFSKPMLWIGNYIAVASLYCTLLMGADLLHNFRNRKLWFPCKYFNINAVSLTVMAVAMKLPVDLSTEMPTLEERVAKRGSIVFMCTMMANSMPSLATMSDKELLANFMAMAVLVITVAVNVCIQIGTGIASASVVNYELYTKLLRGLFISTGEGKFEDRLTIVYVAVVFMLLVISTSSALAIATAKCLLEYKSEAVQKKASNEQEQQRKEITTFEEIKQHVSRYWVMATTGSPQFWMATSPTCSASGIFCVFIAVIHFLDIFGLGTEDIGSGESAYQWSTSVILIIQAIGVAAGTTASLFRCFAALSFELSIKWSSNHINVFIVEKYWTQKFYDWKQRRLPFPIVERRCKLLVHCVKNQILSCCIVLQKVIVVVCKTMGLIPIFLVILLFQWLQVFEENLFWRTYCY